MKSNQYKLMQLHRMNDYYEKQAVLYKRNVISFERLKKWQKINTNIQKEIKKLDPSFGTPLSWQYIQDGAVS